MVSLYKRLVFTHAGTHPSLSPHPGKLQSLSKFKDTFQPVKNTKKISKTTSVGGMAEEDPKA